MLTRFDRTELKTTRARRLRIDATDMERKLWSRLRNAQIENCSFRRQHPIGPFIVDFYCPSRKLVIELDGGQHDERRGYDAARTRFLESKGIRVLRFWNTELMENFEGVVGTVWSELAHMRKLTPTRSATRSDLPLSGGG